MVRKKEGWPREGELVVATVTKIQYHSVFCNLDEYDKSGMIHISEIAPGRIRNIHEHLREGKTVVCKVLQLDKQKGHIDLSLRRVTEQQKRLKSTRLKQEQVVDKIVGSYAEETGEDKDKLIAELDRKAPADFHGVFDMFQAVVEGEFSLDEIVNEKAAEKLEALIKERITPKRVTIQGAFTITSWAPDGVEQIRQAFGGLPDGADVSYAGGGRYTTEIEDKNYKDAEKKLASIKQRVEDTLEEADIAFARTDR